MTSMTSMTSVASIALILSIRSIFHDLNDFINDFFTNCKCIGGQTDSHAIASNKNVEDLQKLTFDESSKCIHSEQ